MLPVNSGSAPCASRTMARIKSSGFCHGLIPSAAPTRLAVNLPTRALCHSLVCCFMPSPCMRPARGARGYSSKRYIVVHVGHHWRWLLHRLRRRPLRRSNRRHPVPSPLLAVVSGQLPHLQLDGLDFASQGGCQVVVCRLVRKLQQFTTSVGINRR